VITRILSNCVDKLSSPIASLQGKTTMETTLEDQVPIGMNGEDAVVDAGIENVAKVGTATSHDSLQAYIYVWASDVELIGDWDYEVKLSHPFS
jgi:hypothetical protein